MPEEVAFLSGRPVLVVPASGRFDSIAENPIVAWKPSRETKRRMVGELTPAACEKSATVRNPSSG